jgi:molybdopterin converting factor small subunit
VTISVALPITVGKLLDALGAQYETFRLARSSVRVAVNQEFATDETLISQDDELAIIPPVSGG